MLLKRLLKKNTDTHTHKLGSSHSAPHHINRTTEEHFYTCKNILVIHRICLGTASGDSKEKLCCHFTFLFFLCSECCVPVPKGLPVVTAPSQLWTMWVGSPETCRTHGLSAVALTPAICSDLLILDLSHFPDPLKQTQLANVLMKSLLQNTA